MRVLAAVDERNLFGRTLTELERDQLPFAAMQAANETGFAVREQWARVMLSVFDRPTPLTQKAVLIRKATRQRPAADIYLRDEAAKGTPPAKYLQAQVAGGTRRVKGVEKRLQASGFLPQGMYVVPGAGAELDAYGNIPGSQVNRILSQLGARFDPYANETATSRDRRRRREAKRGERRGDYFALRQAKDRLKPGVYQRVTTGFGSAVRSILRFVAKVSYRPRYRIFDLAERLYRQQYPFHFNRELAKAVQTATLRGKR
jgi:hypothetical protein